MSKSKLDITAYRRFKKRLFAHQQTFTGAIPLSLREFNQVLNGRKSVAIQVPIEHFNSLEMMLGMYAGMSSVNGKALTMYKSSQLDYDSEFSWHRVFAIAESVRRVLIPSGNAKLNWQQFNSFLDDEKRLNSIPKYYDEFIFNTIVDVSLLSSIRSIFDDSVEVLSNLIQKISESGKDKDKKIVFAIPTSIDIDERNFYNQMWADFQQQFGDKFTYIPYSQEKELVDKVYSKDSDKDANPLIDISFDSSLCAPGLNLSAVYNYLMTNHWHDFKRYAEMFKEEVGKNMREDELKELLK